MLLAFRIDWMMAYQGMVVLAGNQVWWTWEVEDVFRKVKKGDKMGMKNYAKKMHKQISDLVQKVCFHDIKMLECSCRVGISTSIRKTQITLFLEDVGILSPE